MSFADSQHTKSTLHELSRGIIGAAIYVHNELGPGLLESVYSKCLVRELEIRGYAVKAQCKVPLFYRDELLDEKLRLDILVDDTIVVELKAVESLIPLYSAQLLTYLKLAQKPKGLLINFNSVQIKTGLISLVNEQYRELPP